MWFTFRRTIRGRFMDIPSWVGRDGIRIPESGLADRIYPLDSASALGGSAVLDGDGVIGDSIGITTSYCTTTTRISRGARRSITGTIFIVAVGIVAELSTVPAERPGLLVGTGRRPEDMLHPAAKVACGRAHSAATSTVEKLVASRHAEARASADFTAAAVVADSTVEAAGAADS